MDIDWTLSQWRFHSYLILLYFQPEIDRLSVLLQGERWREPRRAQHRERFGVDPGTVQWISRLRPFADGAASVVAQPEGEGSTKQEQRQRGQSLSGCYKIWKERGRPASRRTPSTVDVLALRHSLQWDGGDAGISWRRKMQLSG
jgi:hypothetical protein